MHRHLKIERVLFDAIWCCIECFDLQVPQMFAKFSCVSIPFIAKWACAIPIYTLTWMKCRKVRCRFPKLFVKWLHLGKLYFLRFIFFKMWQSNVICVYGKNILAYVNQKCHLWTTENSLQRAVDILENFCWKMSPPINSSIPPDAPRAAPSMYCFQISIYLWL